MTTKKRNKLVGAIFSLLNPGLGQLYRGQPRKALCISVALQVVLLLGSLLFASIAGLSVFVALFLILLVWSVWDASNNSVIEITPSWYNRWYVYFGWWLIFSLCTDFVSSEGRGKWFEPFKIPSRAMLPTLRVGDHIMVSKRYYKEQELSRGDVVVFKRNENPQTSEDESRVNIVKRVIGLPGDRVRIEGASVFINDQMLSEPYARWSKGGIPEGEFAAQRIPPGHLFLLGDNRDESRDSRFWPEVYIPVQNVLGKVLYIYWSWDSIERIGQDIS